MWGMNCKSREATDVDRAIAHSLLGTTSWPNSTSLGEAAIGSCAISLPRRGRGQSPAAGGSERDGRLHRVGPHTCPNTAASCRRSTSLSWAAPARARARGCRLSVNWTQATSRQGQVTGRRKCTPSPGAAAASTTLPVSKLTRPEEPRRTRGDRVPCRDWSWPRARVPVSLWMPGGVQAQWLAVGAGQMSRACLLGGVSSSD